VKDIGAFAMGTVCHPGRPPFPLTAFVLTSGALKVGLARFLWSVAVARLIPLRRGWQRLRAVMARPLLRLLESPVAQQIVIGLVICVDPGHRRRDRPGLARHAAAAHIEAGLKTRLFVFATLAIGLSAIHVTGRRPAPRGAALLVIFVIVVIFVVFVAISTSW
jgi:hypothetical protein